MTRGGSLLGHGKEANEASCAVEPGRMGPRHARPPHAALGLVPLPLKVCADAAGWGPMSADAHVTRADERPERYGDGSVRACGARQSRADAAGARGEEAAPSKERVLTW